MNLQEIQDILIVIAKLYNADPSEIYFKLWKDCSGYIYIKNYSDEDYPIEEFENVKELVKIRNKYLPEIRKLKLSNL